MNSKNRKLFRTNNKFLKWIYCNAVIIQMKFVTRQYDHIIKSMCGYSLLDLPRLKIVGIVNALILPEDRFNSEFIEPTKEKFAINRIICDNMLEIFYDMYSDYTDHIVDNRKLFMFPGFIKYYNLGSRTAYVTKLHAGASLHARSHLASRK